MSYYWNDRYFNDCRGLPYYEPNWSYRYGYRYPRSNIDSLKCNSYVPAPAAVCVQAPAKVCAPVKVCVPVTRTVYSQEPVESCLRRSNSFVQLTETKSEVRDHDKYDCSYDYKFTEAGDHKSTVKSHKSQISNMSKSMSNMSSYFADVPTSTVEVKPITYTAPSYIPRYKYLH